MSFYDFEPTYVSQLLTFERYLTKNVWFADIRSIREKKNGTHFLADKTLSLIFGYSKRGNYANYYNITRSV